MFDVKLIRPSASAIIAGPYDTKEEAQMHATRLGLEHQKWAKQAREDLANQEFEDELDRRVAERDLEKWISDNETVYEVVQHGKK